MPFTKIVAAGIDSSANINAKGINVSGIITANGLNLSGIITASGGYNLGIQSGGTNVTSGSLTTLNFIGAGNTFSYNSTTKTVDINIGGSQWTYVDTNNVSTSGVYRVNGNIGLGSTNPIQKLQVGSGTSQVFVVTGIGSVGIGTTNPRSRLHVVGDFLLAAGAATTQYITQKSYELNSGTVSWEGSSGQLFSITNNLTSGSIFSVNDVSGIPSIDVDANGFVELAPFNGTVGIATTTPSLAYKLDVAGSVRFGTGANTIVSDSSGRLLVGVTSARSFGSFVAGGAQLQVESTTYQGSSLSLTNNQIAVDGAYLLFGKSRSGSLSGITTVNSGDLLGSIWFSGADGAGLRRGATINVYVDGNAGINSMPGRITFETTPSGSSGSAERARITKDGQFLVGTSSTSTHAPSNLVVQRDQTWRCASNAAVSHHRIACARYTQSQGNTLVTFNVPQTAQFGGFACFMEVFMTAHRGYFDTAQSRMGKAYFAIARQGGGNTNVAISTNVGSQSWNGLTTSLGGSLTPDDLVTNISLSRTGIETGGATQAVALNLAAWNNISAVGYISAVIDITVVNETARDFTWTIT